MLTALIVGLVAFRAPANPATAAESRWLDTSSRSDVAAAYQSEFAQSPPDIGWNGSIASCTAGSTGSEHRAATLRRVNFYRALAGVQPVTYNETLEPAAQAAALVGAANRAITHELPTTAKCYSALAALGASTSNLALGVAGPRAVDAYMDDGIGIMGHRSWLILDSLDSIATGDVHSPWSNAINLGYSTARPTRDGFVAYPGPGWFPAPLLHQTWSVQHSDADFTSATVSVTTAAGAPVASRVVYAGRAVTPILAFAPSIKNPTEGQEFIVSITDAVVRGQRTALTYRVSLFVPNRPPVGSDYFFRAARCAKVKKIPVSQLFDDPEGDSLTYTVSPHAGSLDVLKLRGEHLEFSSHVSPAWGVNSFEVVATDPAGLSSTAVVALMPAGSRACSTTLAPLRVERSSRTAIGALIPATFGKVTHTATGGCRVSRGVVVARPSPGTCLLTVSAVKGASRWTLRRQLRVG